MSDHEKSADRARDVVVGVDGSPAGANAVRYAVGEARHRGAQVHAIGTKVCTAWIACTCAPLCLASPTA